MPVPVVVGAVTAIAARLAAKKLAQEAAKKAAPRVIGGITGKGASKINPVYKETGVNVKVVPPTSKFARDGVNFAEKIRLETITRPGFKRMAALNVNVGKPSATIKINSNK